jgi:hypothetical protein
MSKPPCLDCGITDPAPEMTCDGGTIGGFPHDHFVGPDLGCQHCGRLTEACMLRPCQERRAMWHAIEDGTDG